MYEKQQRLNGSEIIMKTFEIHSIEYGWFEVYLSPHEENFFLINSYYLGCDAPKYFLDALADIYEGKVSEKLLCWQDEPGGSILRLEISGDMINFEAFEADKKTFDLPYAGDELKKYMGSRLFKGSLDAIKFLDDVITGFRLYESGSGLWLYENHWMAFPRAELERLKKYAAKLNKTLDKLDKMFCLTF